jgi:hypothetical protein
MAAAEFTTPELKDYPAIPALQRGAMAESKPYVASDKINRPSASPASWCRTGRPRPSAASASC